MLGHLLHPEGEDAAQRGLDTRHEELAVAALAGHFPAAVLDPIRMHVAAKRYLCFAEPRYLAGLSPASVESLALQGGPMNAAEAEIFLASPYAREAVRLRRADDAAKMQGLAVPALETYRPLLASLWTLTTGSSRSDAPGSEDPMSRTDFPDLQRRAAEVFQSCY